MKLNEIPDKELCALVHEKKRPTKYETELMTRLIERNSGAEEKKGLEIEVDLEDDGRRTIPVDRAMIICAVFLLVQGIFLLYVLPCN